VTASSAEEHPIGAVYGPLVIAATAITGAVASTAAAAVVSCSIGTAAALRSIRHLARA
jgi:uncharacterized membrane protein YdjX (TVP38/TMEM64 family)